MQLWVESAIWSFGTVLECGVALTSSQLLLSSNIQPSSMTSAESLVTYTPCSSQVVATWMTTYRSSLGTGTAVLAMWTGVRFEAEMGSDGVAGSYVSCVSVRCRPETWRGDNTTQCLESLCEAGC